MAQEPDIRDGSTAESTIPALFLGVVVVAIGLVLTLIGYVVFSGVAEPEPIAKALTTATSDIDILIAESKGIRAQLPRTKGVAERNTLLDRRLEIVDVLAKFELNQEQQNFCWISKLESISMLNLLNLNPNVKDSAERLRQLGSITEDAFDVGDPQVRKTALIANEIRLAQTIVFCPEFDSDSTFEMLEKNTTDMLHEYPNDPEAVRSAIQSAKILRSHEFGEFASRLSSEHLSQARSDPELRNLFADEVHLELLGKQDLADFSKRVGAGEAESLQQLEDVFVAAGKMKDVPESVLSSISWLTESLLSNPDTVELAKEYAHKMRTSEPFKSSMGRTLTRLVEGLQQRAAKIGTEITITGESPSGISFDDANSNKPALLLFILNDANTKRSVEFLLREVDDMISNSNLDKTKFDIFIFGNEPRELMTELEKRIARANVLMMQAGGPAAQLELSVFPYTVWLDENRIVKRMNIHSARISKVAFEELNSASPSAAAR